MNSVFSAVQIPFLDEYRSVGLESFLSKCLADSVDGQVRFVSVEFADFPVDLFSRFMQLSLAPAVLFFVRRAVHLWQQTNAMAQILPPPRTIGA